MNLKRSFIIAAFLGICFSNLAFSNLAFSQESKPQESKPDETTAQSVEKSSDQDSIRPPQEEARRKARSRRVSSIQYSLGISIIALDSKTGGKAHRITTIKPESPASIAGLQPNDIVLSLNDIRTGETRTFRDLVQNSKGKKIKLLVERDGKRMNISVQPDQWGEDVIERIISLPSKLDDNPNKKNQNEKNQNETNLRTDKKTDLGTIDETAGPLLVESGRLLERVAIVYHAELGHLAIRGHPDDVKKVEQVIKDFMRVASAPGQRQEVIRLFNIAPTRAATAISEVYDQRFASRDGPVTITARTYPPALVVVGRPNAIKTIRGLVAAFDSMGDK